MRDTRTIRAFLLVTVSLPASTAFAALSPVNNNIRVFEDTIWLFAFTLMLVTGLLMRNISWGLGRVGYSFLVFSALMGWCWKFLGLTKRILVAKEPVWLLNIARETFEGITGVVLAIAFVLLALSIRRLYSSSG